MVTVPIVFAFDNNLVMPACIAISSLLINAKDGTFYDIFILHSSNECLNKSELDKIPSFFSNCKITYREVDNSFDNAFEIRGITTPAYYRLLIPKLIPEYNKILYSDVDVIFRTDLSNIYNTVDIDGYYIAGVNSLSFLVDEYKRYFIDKLQIDPYKVVYSGNLIINSGKILEDNLIPKFIELSKNNYKFQDMDVLNIVCKNSIKYLPPKFCLSTIITRASIYDKDVLMKFWNKEEIEEALSVGIIHYNGQKPWHQYCLHFDIWWEYYRKSPFFDHKYYLDFFWNRLNQLDQLSLMKRIKILVRYFIYGKRNI